MDDSKPLLSLVPEVLEVDKERISSFRVYSVPGDINTTRFDFTITQLDGTEGVRAILHFVTQVEKLRIASNHVTAATMGSMPRPRRMTEPSTGVKRVLSTQE